MSHSTPEQQKRWREANREHVNAYQRGKRRERKYGITVEQYNELLERQDYLCALCKRPETMTRKGIIRALCVDHDHETGRVRGLLCALCNVAIGAASDDPVLLRKMAEYLEDHHAES